MAVILCDEGVVRRKSGHVIVGGIPVDHVVHVVPQEEAGVVHAAERHAAVEEIREAEIEIHGVESARGASESHDPRETVPAVFHVRVITDKGHRVPGDIVDPALVEADPVVGVSVLPAPGLSVYGIDGEDHALSPVDPGGESVRHSEILEIEKTAVLARNKEYGLSRVAVYLDRHRTVQIIAVHLKIGGLHGSFLHIIK